jgi:hypothetical protein
MKFDDVPTDSDTVVTLNLETKFGKYDVLYQQWIWDGIQANSLIFDNDDITDIELELLVEEVNHSPLVNDASKELTTKFAEQFTFINFNFEFIL